MSKAARSPTHTAGRLPWRQALAWALVVLALHALLLHGLGKAFPAVEPHRIAEPVFVHLLVPAARVSQPISAATRNPAPASPSPHVPPAAPTLSLGSEGLGRAPAPATPLPASKASAPPAAPAAGGASTPSLPASPPQPPASGSQALNANSALPNVAAPHPQAATQGSAAPGASSPASSAPAPTAGASSPAGQADALGWPPATQLQYVLSGYYRGPLHGDGSLEWLRDGRSYRVELAGAALVSFAYTSTGHIDGNWLAPDSYVERVFTRRKTVSFNRDHGTLSFSAISTVMPLPSHLQDSASIFMQLAHELTMRPEDFRVGQHMAFEVARPTGTTTWDFIIAGQDVVRTGIGRLLCWHLIHPGDEHGLGAEVWLAPALQNLPVQIRLQQSDTNFLLFTLRQARQE